MSEQHPNLAPGNEPTVASLPKRPLWKRILRVSYFTVLHILAGIALFLIFTALAVQFKWTNDSGSVDVNNRYFAEIADKYDDDFKMDSLSVERHETIFLKKVGLLAKYYPYNARLIMANYNDNKDLKVALRMLDAANIMLKKNKAYQKELHALEARTKDKSVSIYAWTNSPVWKDFCKAIVKDKKAIDSVSRLTGVESRLLVMCLVGEQVRMFNSGREKFKKYVLPYSRMLMPTNRGYGVTGILQNTALKIESNLFDTRSPFYAGDYFQGTVNVNDSFPEVINDSIEAHKYKTIQRLIKGGDHYYSYLYTAYFLRQFQAHWEKEGFDLSNRPEILGTLFNLGYQKSKPKKNPEVGGSTFAIGGKDYTFGGLCFEFYYSGELLKEFPITDQAFIPVTELEKNNKEWLEQIKKASEGILEDENGNPIQPAPADRPRRPNEIRML
jgi:hypothetical protein